MNKRGLYQKPKKLSTTKLKFKFVKHLFSQVSSMGIILERESTTKYYNAKLQKIDRIRLNIDDKFSNNRVLFNTGRCRV